MAATYLTIGSKFKPFSYDELVRPLQEATEAHQALETEYADLDTKAGVWENIANEQTDPVAYRMYKQYSDDLRAQADTLATQGLTPGARQNLMRMKGRYSQEITPIENAYTRRRTLSDEQRKALAENPTLMFQRDVNTMSLDDFIANPELDYGASYSGALLTQQVSNAAANLRREMQNNPRKWQSILEGQYYESLMRTGFTSDEINKAIAGAEDANPILTGIVNDVLSSSGMSSWADESTMLKARAYANQGLWGAIGETSYDTLQNRQWDLDRTPRTKGSNPEPPETLPTYTIGMGHMGEGEDYSDIEKFIETLSLNDGSVSSTELDRLILQYAQDLKTIREVESKYGSYSKTSNVPLGSLGTSGATSLSQAMTRSTSISEGFRGKDGFTSIYDLKNGERSAYFKAREHIYGNNPSTEDTPHKRMQKIQNQINELTQKYGHIPGIDAVDSIKRGVALDKAQNSREVTGIVPRVTPTEQKNAVAAILNGIGLSIGTENSKTKGLVDMETGEQLTGKEVSKLIHDNSSSDDRFQVVATDSEPIVIYDRETGKSYAPHGSIFEIDDYRRRFTSINNFLKDFSNSETGISRKEAEISNVGLTMLTEYGLMPSSGGVNLGDGYRGFITYSEDNDVIKVVVKDDPYTGVSKIVGTSSLNDEINQGALRGNFIKDAATGFLHDIFVLNQAK